ncbi:MAG TPA: histidine utilization repressor [Burkholderiaceae bacterium]|nr:histidine utilization repressor [Burkholderiaceae bacterium]
MRSRPAPRHAGEVGYLRSASDGWGVPEAGSIAPPAAALPLAPYAQVKQYLKDALAAGRWTQGDQMPSEAELVAQFRVSRMTVNRALRELQDAGLVDRVQGLGTFAARLQSVSSTLTIHDIHEEIEARGHRHEARVHLKRAEAAPVALAERLGLQPGATVFHSLIVHHEQGVPLQCEDRYVNPACAPHYLDIDFTAITPTHYLLEVAPLAEAQFSIEAALPTAQEARLLGIVRESPCLVVVRRTLSRGLRATIARLAHPGTRYTLEGQFRP